MFTAYSPLPNKRPGTLINFSIFSLPPRAYLDELDPPFIKFSSSRTIFKWPKF